VGSHIIHWLEATRAILNPRVATALHTAKSSPGNWSSWLAFRAMILNMATRAHAKKTQPLTAANFGVTEISGRFLMIESPPGMVLLLIRHLMRRVSDAFLCSWELGVAATYPGFSIAGNST
jgi:hypothetical protein